MFGDNGTQALPKAPDCCYSPWSQSPRLNLISHFRLTRYHITHCIWKLNSCSSRKRIFFQNYRHSVSSMIKFFCPYQVFSHQSLTFSKHLRETNAHCGLNWHSARVKRQICYHSCLSLLLNLILCQENWLEKFPSFLTNVFEQSEAFLIRLLPFFQLVFDRVNTRNSVDSFLILPSNYEILLRNETQFFLGSNCASAYPAAIRTMMENKNETNFWIS